MYSRFCKDNQTFNSLFKKIPKLSIHHNSLHVLNILTIQPLIKYPDFTKPDANNVSITGIFSQGSVENDKPKTYISKTLKDSKQKSSTIEKGLPAIWSTKIFRPYLFGRKFTIYTDHKPLKWPLLMPFLITLKHIVTFLDVRM